MTSSMVTVRNVADLRGVVDQWRADRLVIGLVPTMGALHDGHLSLVRRALAECDRVIVSIFVNPTQFDNASDLALYPRTADDDAAMLRGAGAHALFMPDVDAMYPAGFATRIHVGGVSEGLCGAHRLGHFDGVATVVTKLLIQSRTDRAYFGERDFQQLQVVRRVAADLDLPVTIVGCPTVREGDGLAMSSRNRRLPVEDRKKAARLPHLMQDAVEALKNGEGSASVLPRLRTALEQTGFGPVEYAELRRADDLTRCDETYRPARLLVAAWLGHVRLIDNLPVA